MKQKSKQKQKQRVASLGALFGVICTLVLLLSGAFTGSVSTDVPMGQFGLPIKPVAFEQESSPLAARSNTLMQQSLSSTNLQSSDQQITLDTATAITEIEAEYEPDEILLLPREGVTANQLSEFLHSVTFAATKEVNADELAAGFVRIKLLPDIDVARAVKTLEQQPIAASCQPNYIYRVADADPIMSLSAESSTDADSAAANISEKTVGVADSDFADSADPADSADLAARTITSSAVTPADPAARTTTSSAVTPADPTVETAFQSARETAGLQGRMTTSADAVSPNSTQMPTEKSTPQPLDQSELNHQPLSAQAVAVNDPRAGSQWALNAINARDAWDTVRAEKNVSVAVLDTGYKVGHEDLQGSIVATYDFVANNGSTRATDVEDENAGSHGTHVAGIIAAQANNEKGVAGVSYDAGLVIMRVMDGDGETNSARVVQALTMIQRQAKNLKIKVANMSFGSIVENTDSQDKALITAIQNVTNAGVLVVGAAGNDGKATSSYFPVNASDAMMGVINLQRSSIARGGASRNASSNYNPAGSTALQAGMDIAAPGTAILSTTRTSTSSYGEMTGTSMAAPCVSGVAALVFAANPSLTPEQVKDILHATTTDVGGVGWDASTGYGMVNAAAAVQSADYFKGTSKAMLMNTTLQLEPIADTSSPVTTRTWTWVSSNTQIATVDSSGTVFAKSGGRVTITAKSRDYTISRTLQIFDPAIEQVQAAEVGSFGKFVVMGYDSSKWVWTIVDGADKASINVNTGVVTGLSSGQITIKATLASDNSIFTTLSTEVTQPQLAGVPFASVGGTTQLFVPNDSGMSANASLSADDVDAEWEWSSDNTAVATVDATSGCVTGVSDGQATITATRVSSDTRGSADTFETLKRIVTIYDATVTGKTSLSYKDTAVYSVASHQIGDWVYSSSNSAALTVNANTGAASAQGVGRVVVSATLSLDSHISGKMDVDIVRRSLAGCAISGVVNTTYTAAPFNQDVSVLLKGTLLSKGTDYTLTYLNAAKASLAVSKVKPAGTYYVRITGIGNYEGTAEARFFILKAAQSSFKAKPIVRTAKVTKLKKKNLLLKKAVKVTGAKGAVRFIKKSGSPQVKIAQKTGKVTVKKGTRKGTYKIKVLVRSAETTNYRSATKTITVKVRVR